MVKQLLALLLWISFSLSFPLQAFSQLHVQLDKNPVMLGESITLTVVADGKVSADALQYRALEQHFRVMVPSVSQSTQVINGQSSHNTTWSVTLFPLSTGTFTIPSFDIAGVQSAPVDVKVIEQSQTTGEPKELFVEAHLQNVTDIYVQQMLYYDVVIYFSGDLQRGNLSEPQLEGAEIHRVGQDAEGSELVDGVRYRTITRRYSITPQRSGNFTIMPPMFTGEILDRDSSRYNYFARSKTVMHEAQPIELEVKAQPANFPGNWLIAGLVTLSEEWQPEPTELQVGEPVTRIVTLSAVDIAANQLPELNQQLPSQLRLYQEQPQSKSAERAGRMVAQKVFTTAIIANESGELTLPAIQIPWWNSQTNQLQTAELPARTLHIKANPASSVPEPMISTAPEPQAVATSPWQWNYLSYLLLSGWLISMVLLWLYKKPASPKAPPAKSEHTAPFANKELQQACQQGNANLAHQLLLSWATTYFKQPVRSLGQLTLLINNAALNTEIRALEQHLYRSPEATWQGVALYSAWQQLEQTTPDKEAQLGSLYPT